jgi:hypothetical protein
MPRRRRRQKQATSALAIVRAARAAAKNALDSLREEIRGTTAKLAKLVAEERSFKTELFGGGAPAASRRGRKAPRGPKRRRRGRRKGTPKAERFFQKLSNTFTLEDVRKLAGKRAGISLAQWSRAKRIRKAGKGYQKVAA